MGIFLNNSIYPPASLAINQLLDNRAIPITNPIILAKIIPTTDTTIVFISPT
jgi:hypothetical protein